MKKKESIFYEANSFPSPGPDILELKGDNKGSVMEGCFQGLEDQLTERKIKNFWKKMDELNVWNWQKKYEPAGRICDGHMWKLYLRNREGRSMVANGHEEYPHNFKKVLNALNNLFGSKVGKGESFKIENEVIELSAEYYKGHQYISLENNVGLVDELGNTTKVKIDEFKKQNFWKKIDELGVWNWHSKYPHRQPKYEAPTCQTFWRLKIINHDKAKYCSGYYFFPRNFKKFTKELSILMGVEINID